MSNAYVRETREKRRPGTRGVLVVDDDPALVRLIRMTLSLGGFDVMSAMNGAEALEAVRAHEPHVILLDVEMPVMDGREFYRELRNQHCDVPVVIFTANEPLRVQRELGAQAHVRKPFEPEELIETLDSLMQ